jgi:hypothetical protein
MRKTLIAEYHNSLAGDEGVTAEFFARLKSMMRARLLLYGAREIGVALRPHLLTEPSTPSWPTHLRSSLEPLKK